jgi:hypothetical protein
MSWVRILHVPWTTLTWFFLRRLHIPYAELCVSSQSWEGVLSNACSDCAGDRIFLFGFSRGAYTARVLAGMLHKVGLLPRDNMQHVASAYDMSCSTDEESWEMARHFKKCFCINVDIEFIGVWYVFS